jgi:hypothetical protein
MVHYRFGWRCERRKVPTLIIFHTGRISADCGGSAALPAQDREEDGEASE